MRSASKGFPIAMLALLLTPCAGAQAVDTDHHERRERAAREFPDGLVLLHASSQRLETVSAKIRSSSTSRGSLIPCRRF
jgi:hypothetical protein